MAGVLVEALVDVDGAELAGVAAALTDRAREVLLAHPLVLAGVGVAVLPVLTPLPAQPLRALAHVVVVQVDALPAVEAGLGGARVEVELAP